MFVVSVLFVDSSLKFELGLRAISGRVGGEISRRIFKGRVTGVGLADQVCRRATVRV